MTIRARLIYGFSTLLAIFVISALVNLQLSNEVSRNINYLSNSESVIRNSHLIHRHIIDMQSGFRGFLLTGQESFLQGYNEGRKKVPGLISLQESLLTNYKQKQRFDSIHKKHMIWVDYADSLIENKKEDLKGHQSRYLELFEKKLKMEVGKKLNDDIVMLFSRFDQEEYELRISRRERLEESVSRTAAISSTLTVIFVIIATIFAYFITRSITKRIKSMVALAGDISEGKFRTIEDQGRDELRSLSESLNRMSHGLETSFRNLASKNQELDQFAYVVSHDLKAPLRGIDSIIKWTLEDHSGNMSPEIRKNIDLIQGRTMRLESMINGLLEYARIGRVSLKTEEVDVKELILDLRDMIAPKDFDFQIKTEMPVLNTQKLRLEQVFSNLISNAVKHNKSSDGRIEISCRTLSRHYEFHVHDNGPGIEKIYQEKIFQIFQTLVERDAFESTGVGLAIVKKIVEEQGGTIRVQSEPGSGSTFIFTWSKDSKKKQNESKNDTAG